MEANAICYNAMIDVCAKAGDISKAETWLQKMSDAGHKPDEISYNAVIDACSKAKDINSAEQWFKNLLVLVWRCILVGWAKDFVLLIVK